MIFKIFISVFNKIWRIKDNLIGDLINLSFVNKYT